MTDRTETNNHFIDPAGSESAGSIIAAKTGIKIESYNQILKAQRVSFSST